MSTYRDPSEAKVRDAEQTRSSGPGLSAEAAGWPSRILRRSERVVVRTHLPRGECSASAGLPKPSQVRGHCSRLLAFQAAGRSEDRVRAPHCRSRRCAPG
jgi:hypothetical protein